MRLPAVDGSQMRNGMSLRNRWHSWLSDWVARDFVRGPRPFSNTCQFCRWPGAYITRILKTPTLLAG